MKIVRIYDEINSKLAKTCGQWRTVFELLQTCIRTRYHVIFDLKFEKIIKLKKTALECLEIRVMGHNLWL